MKDPRDIIIAPVISEKSIAMIEQSNTYTFKVDKRANKVEIRKAIEEIFNVNVLKVNTVNMLGKTRRLGYQQGKRPDWKKAMVKLAEGNRIEIFEGL
ncbi:MAG: 50S ribosomal protein L23 [Halanaerobiaceae bacterium]|nr:50S ribosomal protein L23 [Halanaerobiaceae bacterium]